MTPASKSPSKLEFTAMMGVLFATIAFSMDAMLPALPQIAAELSPDDINRAQLILTSFIFGMGIGIFIAGPISDALGRKPVIYLGAGFYALGAILAHYAPSLELVLAARVLQGIGAAGPRVVTLAMVRDLYQGRAMAQIVSYAMLVFTIFPAIAPLIGAAIIAGFGWRAIFVAFLVFIVLSVSWLGLRQPETLPPERRQKPNLAALKSAISTALGMRQMQLSILVQTCVFGALFGVISSIQQVFDLSFGRGAEFPFWFCAIALMAAPSGPINGKMVMRFGMRAMVRGTLFVVLFNSSIALLAFGLIFEARQGFALYIAWTLTIFAAAAFTLGNLNALALEPLGHIAGTASSVMGAIATIGGAVLGAIVGQFFDGTPLPLISFALIFAAIAVGLMQMMPKSEQAG